MKEISLISPQLAKSARSLDQIASNGIDHQFDLQLGGPAAGNLVAFQQARQRSGIGDRTFPDHRGLGEDRPLEDLV
jgi:hypothetical protein